MEFIECDNQNLIDFYVRNGLEFDENKSYFGTNVKSFILKDNETIVGAVSISTYMGKSFIEAIAVNVTYRNKGYGKMLLNKAIELLAKPIYVI